MTDHVYKSIEITGSSPAGLTEAIDRAITKASQSVRNIDWFEVTEIRGHVEEGSVGHYQVTLKVGFRLED
jgi:dodecin